LPVDVDNVISRWDYEYVSTKSKTAKIGYQHYIVIATGALVTYNADLGAWIATLPSDPYAADSFQTKAEAVESYSDPSLGSTQTAVDYLNATAENAKYFGDDALAAHYTKIAQRIAQ
jgi:hypothetical protein